MKILVTGFDPFGEDKPGQGAWRPARGRDGRASARKSGEGASGCGQMPARPPGRSLSLAAGLPACL